MPKSQIRVYRVRVYSDGSLGTPVMLDNPDGDIVISRMLDRGSNITSQFIFFFGVPGIDTSEV